MFKKSLKYLTIAFVNILLLTAFLFFWTDELEMTFNYGVLVWEQLKIIGFGILSLIAMRFLVSYFRNKKIVDTGLKIKVALLLTFLVSSYLYVDYSSKIIKNVIVNGRLRKQIANKIKPSDKMSGSKGENLTSLEYQTITEIYWFPKLPIEASNISYVYEYDGFLPDYLFELTYDLPKHLTVDTFNVEREQFSRYQSCIIKDNTKKVTYTEILR